MKPCTHTFWLGLQQQGSETLFLVSDRAKKLTTTIPECDVQQPSLYVLIGNTTKSAALREVFGVRRSRRVSFQRSHGLHLHVDPSSIFRRRPLLIAEGDIRSSHPAKHTEGKCHRVSKRTIERSRHESTIAQISSSVYSQLLYPFTDVFVFFSDDIGGLRQVASCLVHWLQNGYVSTLSHGIRPKVVVAIESTTVSAASEKKYRAAFLKLLSEETAEDPMQRLSSIDIVALFPSGSISSDARFRALKELLMDRSDEVREARCNSRHLFSVPHFTALLESACENFVATSPHPFDCIQASRSHNPVARDQDQHVSNFLRFINTPGELLDFAAPVLGSSMLLDNYLPDNHLFWPSDVFRTLYREILLKVSDNRVMCFDQSSDVMLRSGFIDVVEKHLGQLFERLIREAKTSAEIHAETLIFYRDRLKEIYCNTTCLSCLRRRPQYGLHCGHIVCENCVLIFGDPSPADPWLFEVKACFVCGEHMAGGVLVRVHPPTAGVGVLCIDGGGVRGIAPLRIMRRIQERISLPISFQRLFQVAFGISSGGLIVADVFVNGKSIDESTDRFETLARMIFRRRELIIPFLPRFLRPLVARIAGASGPFPQLFRLLDVIVSYFADGLYPPENIEAALQQTFGNERGLLDVSHATASGTLVGLPAATVSKRPCSRIFTNYNGVGDRSETSNHVIKEGNGLKRVKLWEILRAICAAPGYFPPKNIENIGVFQDAGPLENDPLISALSEAAVMYPHVEEPNFVVSLGTGEPAPDGSPSTDVSRDIRKNGTLPRLFRLFWEKMRDEKMRQVFQGSGRYHRLNVRFDDHEPRLDDTRSIGAVKLIADSDQRLTTAIERVAYCITASLFYFELETRPETFEGDYIAIGHILCSLRHGDPAFSALCERLSLGSSQFLLDGCPVGAAYDTSCLSDDGNFQRRVEIRTAGEFRISIKQESAEPHDISGSPFSIESLLLAQGFTAVFGRPECKRKRLEDVTHQKHKFQRLL